VLGVLLQQHGYLTLHASAVAIGAQAIAFLGHRGEGKSTIAAALHARGHAIVADDIVAVELDAGKASVYPGFPRLKLWPDALSSLGEDAQTLSRLRPELEKRCRPAPHGFHRAPLPIGRLYVLADGATPSIEALGPQEGIVELLRHSYGIQALHAAGGAAAHLRQCSALAACTEVRRLQRPRSLAGLPTLASVVEDDLYS
jgi:hypothetical protein